MRISGDLEKMPRRRRDGVFSLSSRRESSGGMGNCLLYLAVVVVAALQVFLSHRGELDWPSFMSSKLLLVVVRDVFPKTDLSDLESVRNFVENNADDELCKEYQIKCPQDLESSATVIPDLNGVSLHQIPQLVELIVDHEVPLLTFTLPSDDDKNAQNGDNNYRDANVHIRLYYPHINPDVSLYGKSNEKSGVPKRPALLWLHSGGWTLGR